MADETEVVLETPADPYAGSVNIPAVLDGLVATVASLQVSVDSILARISELEDAVAAMSP